MDLKFSFGGASPDRHDHGAAPSGIPLPFAGAASTPVSTSHVLELRATLSNPDSHAPTVIANALSGDGVSYARAEKLVTERTPAGIATATRSALARAAAELGDPLVQSVTAVVLQLGEHRTTAFHELGLASAARPGAAECEGVMTEVLQARTGVTAGTIVRTQASPALSTDTAAPLA